MALTFVLLAAAGALMGAAQPSAPPPAVPLEPTRLPAPGVVVLHSHDGVYLWGKEKVVENDQEHPYLTAFKQRS